MEGVKIGFLFSTVPAPFPVDLNQCVWISSFSEKQLTRHLLLLGKCVSVEAVSAELGRL